MNNQTMAAPYQQAPMNQMPVQEEAIRIPPPGMVQTSELDDARWKALRADMCEVVAGIAHKLGFNLVADENLLKMGFPVEDQSRYENGDMDMDFEESSIEALGRIEIKAGELAEIARRFRWNLMVRNHESLATDGDGEGEGAPQQ
jgi:hypothetical protein